MILEELVREEVNKQTNGTLELTEQMLEKCIQEIKDNCDNLDEMPDTVSDFIANEFAQCDICGEYVPIDYITDAGRYRVCSCVECRQEAIDRTNFNPRREWGTY